MGKTLERESKYHTALKRCEHFTVCNFYKTFKKRRKIKHTLFLFTWSLHFRLR